MAVSMTYTRTAARNLFYIRAYSFTSIGAGAFILPFLALFYQEQGLSGSQIGVLVATAGIVGTLAAPIWGRWSDSSLRPRRLLQLALLGSGARLADTEINCPPGNTGLCCQLLVSRNITLPIWAAR